MKYYYSIPKTYEPDRLIVDYYSAKAKRLDKIIEQKKIYIKKQENLAKKNYHKFREE